MDLKLEFDTRILIDFQTSMETNYETSHGDLQISIEWKMAILLTNIEQ